VSRVRVFAHRHLVTSLTNDEITALRIDFKLYKEAGALPDTFGRDTLYNHPNSLPIVLNEQLFHIHLADELNNWSEKTLQFYRTSDTHLVYCQGDMQTDCYLLMAILAPDAHAQVRSNSVMYSLGQMAELFRGKH